MCMSVLKTFAFICRTPEHNSNTHLNIVKSFRCQIRNSYQICNKQKKKKFPYILAVPKVTYLAVLTF